jgi:hypothetical protein
MILISGQEKLQALRSGAASRSAFRTPHSALRNAFTLVEILVTVGLLSFIILGLMMMFNQTQRVFRSGMTQSDVLESGRAITDMVVQELQQAVPTYAGSFNAANGRWTYSTNLYAELADGFNPALLQSLPGTVNLRTNVVQNVFLVTKTGQNWSLVGYAVLPEYNGAGVGTLYRYWYQSPTLTNEAQYLCRQFRWALDWNLFEATNGWPITNQWQVLGINNNSAVSRIADGVVHFQIRPFSPAGFPILGEARWQTNALVQTNGLTTNQVGVQSATVIPTNGLPGHVLACYFWSNSVPGALEFELGVLEPQALRKYTAIGKENSYAQHAYLSNHVGMVHLFRQRTQVRGVDPNAYTNKTWW